MTIPAPVRETRIDVETFVCHLCGGSSFCVVFDARGRGQGTIGEVAAYACANRGTSDGLRVVECTECRLRALFPMLPAADVEHAYGAAEDPEYLAIEPHRRFAFRTLIERVGKHRARLGKLLDVGCYTGLFPLLAREAGWDVYGVEPSRWAAAVASDRLPSRIVNGFLRDEPFAPHTFDVITSWDVIEHVSDPRADLTRMAELLVPGGLLFLSTLSAEALIVRLLGRRWPWYMEMHRYYFTPRTLGMLLEETGFAVRAIERSPHTTSLRYVCWKLEPRFGRLARWAGTLARTLGIAERPISVDLRDVFIAVAERR